MSYIDTSVLVAYYCPESLSSAVQKTLARIPVPTVSPLVEVEMYSAVAIKVRTGGLEAAVAQRVFAQFQTHLAESRFQVLPIQAADYALSREWISQLSSPLRVLDAIHLATAHRYGLTLLTADRQLARSAKHFGVACKLLE